MSNDKLRKAAEDVIAWFSKRAVAGWAESEDGLRINTLRAALAGSADAPPEVTGQDEAYRIAAKMCPTCGLPNNNFCHDPFHSTEDAPLEEITSGEYRAVSPDVRRQLRLEPAFGHDWSEDEMKRLPSILRLGVGPEDSLGTQLMRLAADEIVSLRAALAVAQKEES